MYILDGRPSIPNVIAKEDTTLSNISKGHHHHTMGSIAISEADFTATLEKYAAEAPADQCGSPSETEAEDNK